MAGRRHRDGPGKDRAASASVRRDLVIVTHPASAESMLTAVWTSPAVPGQLLLPGWVGLPARQWRGFREQPVLPSCRYFPAGPPLGQPASIGYSGEEEERRPAPSAPPG